MNSLILFLCLNILIITAPCCGQATGNGDNRSPSMTWKKTAEFDETLIPELELKNWIKILSPLLGIFQVQYKQAEDSKWHWDVKVKPKKKSQNKDDFSLLNSTDDDQDDMTIAVWYNMIGEMLQRNADIGHFECVQRSLCIFNKKAFTASEANWVFTLSSFPLSYLLHTQHNHGFIGFIHAALKGTFMTNCYEAYSECSGR